MFLVEISTPLNVAFILVSILIVIIINSHDYSRHCGLHSLVSYMVHTMLKLIPQNT